MLGQNLLVFFFIIKNMNPHEEEEDEGPSVDSAIAEERIAARRIRIQRRLEAAKRLVELILFLSFKTCILFVFCIIVKFFNVIVTSREASGEDVAKKKPVDSEKDALKSRKQMEDSRQVTDKNSVFICNR